MEPVVYRENSSSSQVYSDNFVLLYLRNFQHRGSYGRFIQHALQVAIIEFKGDISVGIARRFGTFVDAVAYKMFLVLCIRFT
jgi:hypothetical protein